MDRRQFVLSSASLALTLRHWQRASSMIVDGKALPPKALGHALMMPNLDHSLAVRCLKKTVLGSQTIDDMETDRGWIASPVVKLSYTQERAKSGSRSMRFSTLMRNEE